MRAMKPIKVLVVDDEPLARRRLLRLLREAGYTFVDEAASGEQAVTAIMNDPPELVLLDVQMPGMDGFGVIERVGAERMPVTVFVTAYDQYALRAFEVHALDYLLKPVDGERLAVALRRAESRLERDAAAGQREALAELMAQFRNAVERFGPAERAGGQYLDRMMVTLGGRMRLLRAAEIDWIEAEGNYVRLHVGKQSCLIRETMVNLEQRLDPARFLRAHRSVIVNMDRVIELHPAFNGNFTIRLETGKELPLSRRFRDRMRDRIGAYS